MSILMLKFPEGWCYLFLDGSNLTFFRYKVLGEIKNTAANICLDTMGRKENQKVGCYQCHGQGGNQVEQKSGLTGEIIGFDLGLLVHNG